MCGIAGFAGKQRAAPVLLGCLNTLEYRGYDSAGMATLTDGVVSVKKDVGKVANVSRKLALDQMEGEVGIAHVRWATHGGVSTANAHPHTDCKHEIALVHNGIIENYQELRKELQHKHTFASETDTETVSHLVEEAMDNGASLERAVLMAAQRLHGSYALAVVSSRDSGKIVAIRKGSPLIVGAGKDGFFAASDVISLLGRVDRVYHLDEDEVAIITPGGVTFLDTEGHEKTKEAQTALSQWQAPSKNGHRFFMLKEILEQPQVLEQALIQDGNNLLEIALDILRARDVVITACGTSRHASLVGRYLFSRLGGKFCEVVMGSEFEYFADSVGKNTLVIAVSQSGETADVIRGVQTARANGARIVSVVNVPHSSLARMSDRVIPINCGPELCVAATKSFLAQLAVFYRLGFAMINAADEGVASLRRVAHAIEENLTLNGNGISQLAESTRKSRDFYFLGRGINFAIATEGALKMKEVSYVHAEGMPAGELKHGTLALISEGTPVLAICPKDYTYYDTLSNAMETRARGAFVIGLSDEDNEVFHHWIKIPKVEEIFYPLVSVIPLQLLAYYSAVLRRVDPDRPRNLAKSVTVK